MRCAAPNLGPDYGRQFDAIYPELARKYGAALYPFFLDGVVMQPELNQPDGMHPNARGVEILAERIAPYIKRLVEGGAPGGAG
jgi:acyl-CoA thioesterase-1